MKNILFRLLPVMLLTLFYYTTVAQTDSLTRLKRIKDSTFRLTHPGHYVPDSFYRERLAISKKIRRDSLYRTKEGMFAARKKIYDTTYKRMGIERKKIALFKDTAFRKNIAARKINDSVMRKTGTGRISVDSMYGKKTSFPRMRDSLRRLGPTPKLKIDSLRRVNGMSLRLDTLHRFKKFQSLKLDSVKRVLFLQHIKTDSQRIKTYLQYKKLQLRQSQDTATLKNGYRSRNLSMEITCNPGDTAYINNHYKKVIIKVVPAQRMRLTALINYRDEIDARDAEIFKMMGVTVSRCGSHVTATAEGVRPAPNRDNNNDKSESLPYDKDALFNKDLLSDVNLKRTLFMEVPENAIIFLTSRYADDNIENYVQTIHAEIINGSLRMGNAGNAVIKSKYSTINADDITKANLNLSVTRFTASNIVTMAVVSNSSTLQLGDCTTIDMASTSDEYHVAKAGSISGNKDFGKFNIEMLNKQLVLSGTNGDLKIYNLSAEAPLIKIDSKYADLKIPVYDQKNYSIHYEGSYNDVNKISSVSQNVKSSSGVAAAFSVQKDTLVGIGKQSRTNKTKFEAIAGDIKGTHTRVDIVCPFCNVVFN